jgi:hypothetical protein
MPIIYTDPNADVPPGVDFLDDAQTDAWVAACETNKPWSVPVREHFREIVSELPAGARVLELTSRCVSRACARRRTASVSPAVRVRHFRDRAREARRAANPEDDLVELPSDVGTTPLSLGAH